MGRMLLFVAWSLAAASGTASAFPPESIRARRAEGRLVREDCLCYSGIHDRCTSDKATDDVPVRSGAQRGGDHRAGRELRLPGPARLLGEHCRDPEWTIC